MRLLGRVSSHLRERRGQAFVEFAMVLPILALMLFATVDFARVFVTALAVSNGAREGARQGAVYAACVTPTDPNSIQQRIRNNTDGVVAWSLVTPVITYYNTATTPTPVTTPVAGGAIQVQVTTSYEPITPLVGPIIGNPNINASSIMVIENPSPCLTAVPTSTPTPTATVFTATPTPPATPTPVPPTLTPTPCPAPDAPTVTSVVRTTGSNHEITWSSVAGAVTYNLYRVGAATNPVIPGLTSSPAIHNATGTHNHIYYVGAVNACGESAASNQVTEP